jgi:hypothetical protein
VCKSLDPQVLGGFAIQRASEGQRIKSLKSGMNSGRIYIN